MKKIICLLILLISNLIYCQDCNTFQKGIFENKNDYGGSIIERKDSFQLERTLDNKTIYLQHIEKKSDCEYKVILYKVISIGNLPKPTADEAVKVKITQIEKNNFSYTTNLDGTELIVSGTFYKIADEISDDFKKILSTIEK